MELMITDSRDDRSSPIRLKDLILHANPRIKEKILAANLSALENWNPEKYSRH